MKLLLWLSFITLFCAQEISIIALRVEFKKDSSEFTTGNGLFDMRQPDIDSVKYHLIDPPPHNKAYFESHLTYAKHYFQKVLNRSVSFKVFPEKEKGSYRLSKEMFHYNPNKKGDEVKGLVNLYKETYELAEPDLPVMTSETIVIVFHAGVGQDIALGYTDYTPNDIPSISITSEMLSEHANGWNKAGKGIILPETVSQDGLQLALNGLVVAHIGTQLGFLDMINPVEKKSVVGPWGLEDRGLFNGNGLLPSIPGAPNRVFKRISPEKIVEISLDKLPTMDTLLTLDHIEKENSTHPFIYKIPLNETEYYLVENRYRPNLNGDAFTTFTTLQSKFTPTGNTFLNYKQVIYHPEFQNKEDFKFNETTGVLESVSNYDYGIPHSGIAIWRVNQSFIDSLGSTNNINSDGIIPAVKFIEADGVENYGTIAEGAHDERYDIFFEGNKARYYQNEISLGTSVRSSSGYEMASSGLILSKFSRHGETVSFQVKREGVDYIPHGISVLKGGLYRNGKHYLYTSDKLMVLDRELKELHESNHNALQKLLATKQGLYLFKENRLYTVDSTTFDLTEFLSLIDDAMVVDSKLFVLKGPNYFGVTNNSIEDVAFKGEDGLVFDIENNTYASLQIEKNKLVAYSDNFQQLFGYPKVVPYKFRDEHIVQVKQFGEFLLCIDKNKLIKIISINGKTLHVPSFYFGKNLRSIVLTEDQSSLIVYTDTHIIRQTVDLTSVKRAPRLVPKERNYSGFHSKLTFLWPNPNIDEIIKIRTLASQSGVVTARVYNAVGTFIDSFTYTISANQEQDYLWNVSRLASGSYLIQLHLNGHKKILKATVIH